MPHSSKYVRQGWGFAWMEGEEPAEQTPETETFGLYGELLPKARGLSRDELVAQLIEAAGELVRKQIYEDPHAKPAHAPGNALYCSGCNRYGIVGRPIEHTESCVAGRVSGLITQLRRPVVLSDRERALADLRKAPALEPKPTETGQAREIYTDDDAHMDGHARMILGAEPQQEAEYSPELVGTMQCDICGRDTPHTHSSGDVERERYCRPAFEKFFDARLVTNHEGLDPAGTYGWALHWKTRYLLHYHHPQVEVSWEIWQSAWHQRGEMFPEMVAACKTAAGEIAQPEPQQEAEGTPRGEKEMANCELCGEPMPQGEEMFKYHGYSGPCPKPPLPKESQPALPEPRIEYEVEEHPWASEEGNAPALRGLDEPARHVVSMTHEQAARRCWAGQR